MLGIIEALYAFRRFDILVGDGNVVRFVYAVACKLVVIVAVCHKVIVVLAYHQSDGIEYIFCAALSVYLFAVYVEVKIFKRNLFL